MMFKTPFLSEPIVFRENEVPVLVVENAEVLRNIIADILSQKDGEDGKNIFSEQYKPLSIKKQIEIIIDPFSLSLNDRKIMNGTLQYINSVINMKLLSETVKIKGFLWRYVEQLMQEVELPFICQENFDVGAILKAIGLQYDEKNYSFQEKILEYLKIYRFLFDTQCFVFINLKSFLFLEELEMMYKDLQMEQIQIFLLESKVFEEVDGERQIILDKDLCVL